MLIMRSPRARSAVPNASTIAGGGKVQERTVRVPRITNSNAERTFQVTSSARLSAEARSELGKSLRKQTPRTTHAENPFEAAGPDPIGLLEEQNKDRLGWLVPVRRGRFVSMGPFGEFTTEASRLAY